MHRTALIAYVILPPSIVEAGNVTHVVENDEVDSAEVRVPEENVWPSLVHHLPPSDFPTARRH